MIEDIINAQGHIMRVLERELLDSESINKKGLTMLKTYYIEKYNNPTYEPNLSSFEGMVAFFTEYVSKLLQLQDYE